MILSREGWNAYFSLQDSGAIYAARNLRFLDPKAAAALVTQDAAIAMIKAGPEHMVIDSALRHILPPEVVRQLFR